MGHKKERLREKRKASKEHDGNGSEGRISISDLIPLGNLTTRAHVRRKRNEFLAENPPKLRYFDTLARNATPNPPRVQKTHRNLVAFLIIAAWAAIFWFHAPRKESVSAKSQIHWRHRPPTTGATGRLFNRRATRRRWHQGTTLSNLSQPSGPHHRYRSSAPPLSQRLFSSSFW